VPTNSDGYPSAIAPRFATCLPVAAGLPQRSISARLMQLPGVRGARGPNRRNQHGDGRSVLSEQRPQLGPGSSDVSGVQPSFRFGAYKYLLPGIPAANTLVSSSLRPRARESAGGSFCGRIIRRIPRITSESLRHPQPRCRR